MMGGPEEHALVSEFPVPWESLSVLIAIALFFSSNSVSHF
jgi:hypothetical protein